MNDLLVIACPHCGAAEPDELECLPRDRVAPFRCHAPGCAHTFRFLIAECLRCANEHAFSWSVSPSLASLQALACPDCKAPYERVAPE